MTRSLLVLIAFVPACVAPAEEPTGPGPDDARICDDWRPRAVDYCRRCWQSPEVTCQEGVVCRGKKAQVTIETYASVCRPRWEQQGPGCGFAPNDPCLVVF